jgi:hypothetical protein
MFLLVAIAIRNYLASTGVFCYIIPSTCAITFLGFAYHGVHRVLGEMFPISALHWSSSMGPNVRQSVRNDAKRLAESKIEEIALVHGNRIVEEAKGEARASNAGDNYGADVIDEGVEMVRENAQDWSSSEEEDMMAFISKALKRSSEARRSLLTIELLKAGYIADSFVSGNSQVIFMALGDEQFGTEFMSSEKLGICSYAAVVRGEIAR